MGLYIDPTPTASDKIIINGPGDQQGEMEADGFELCPFCLNNNRMVVSYNKYMTRVPPYEYVFDLAVTCLECGVSMEAEALDMPTAIAQLQDRWNRRPKRDDFSRELFKARMYDKQEQWNKEEHLKWGPFTVDQIEMYFDKSIFELIRTFSDENANLRNENTLLSMALEQATKADIAYSPEAQKGMERGYQWSALGNHYLTGEVVSQNSLAAYEEAARKSREAMQRSAQSLSDSIASWAEGFKQIDFSELRKALDTLVPPDEVDALMQRVEEEKARQIREANIKTARQVQRTKKGSRR